MANRLFSVLDGIISDKEHATRNLSSIDDVINYADACGENITAQDAGRIIEIGTRWLHEQENGNGEWSRMRHEAEAALSDD
jgi:hypothetical protein